MDTMQALILRHGGNATSHGAVANELPNPGDYLELAEIPVPKPKAGQVLIKVKRSTVNPSDVGFVVGSYGQPRVAGRPPGFEGTGTVVAAGPGLMPSLIKGRDVAFAVTPDGSGAWAEYAVTHAAAAIALKRGVAERDAAAMIVNPATVAAMLDLVKPGEAFVFSAAASQLGKLMAALSKDHRKRMIAIVRRDAPMEALRKLGATEVLNETSPNFASDLKAILDKRTSKIFLDAVAGGASPAIFGAMGRGARWIIYGKLDDSGAAIPEPGEMIFLDKKVEGFWLSTWFRTAPLWKKMMVTHHVQARFRDGRWQTDIVAEIPLSDAIARLPEALAMPDGKVQIVMEQSL